MSEVNKLISVDQLRHYHDKLQNQLADSIPQDYVTNEELHNIDFYNIVNNPIVNNEEGKLIFTDESGNIGLQINKDNQLVVSDVLAAGHTLSEKADKSFVEDNYYNKSTVDKKITEAVTDGQISLDGFATEQWVNNQGFLKEHQDISQLAEKSELPTKTSDLTNDSGFITINDVPAVELPSLDEYAKTEDLPNFDEFAKTTDIPNLNGYASKEWVNNKNYATEYDLKNIDYSSINNVPITEDETGELNITDESGNVGFKVSEEGIFVKDVIAGDHILSKKMDNTEFKTINGESILGNGNIDIRESNVYIMPMPISEFMQRNQYDFTKQQITELVEAVTANKHLVFITSSDSEYSELVFAYSYSFFTGNAIIIKVLYQGTECSRLIRLNENGGSFENSSFRKFSAVPKTLIQQVDNSNTWTFDPMDMYTDEHISRYFIEGECEALQIYELPYHLPISILFYTGKTCSLELGQIVFWPNGEAPTIEPYTYYELSISDSLSGYVNAVLIPFKPVTSLDTNPA